MCVVVSAECGHLLCAVSIDNVGGHQKVYQACEILTQNPLKYVAVILASECGSGFCACACEF